MESYDEYLMAKDKETFLSDKKKEMSESVYDLYIKGLIFTYRSRRKSEYPPIEDLIDGMAKDDQSQIKQYYDKCLEIKNKYPKVS